MRYCLFALIALISFSCKDKGKSITNKNVPKLNWNDTILELGTMKKDTSYRFSFAYSISGSSNLRFEKIETSCGCTVIQLKDTGKLFPGRQYRLEGELNTHELNGEVDKAIYILTNGEPQFSLLKILGHVQ